MLTAPVAGDYTFTYEHLGNVHTHTQTRIDGEFLVLGGTLFNERARVIGCFTNSDGEKIADENGVTEIFVEVKSFGE